MCSVFLPMWYFLYLGQVETVLRTYAVGERHTDRRSSWTGPAPPLPSFPLVSQFFLQDTLKNNLEQCRAESRDQTTPVYWCRSWCPQNVEAVLCPKSWVLCPPYNIRSSPNQSRVLERLGSPFRINKHDWHSQSIMGGTRDLYRSYCVVNLMPLLLQVPSNPAIVAAAAAVLSYSCRLSTVWLPST